MNKSTIMLSATIFGFIGGYAPVLLGSDDITWSVLGGMLGGFFGIWFAVWISKRIG